MKFKNILHRLGLLFALVALASCTETQFGAHVLKNLYGPSDNQGTFKVGNPYKADGKWYTPRETYQYSETGIASWYGAEFQGHRTANGEIFDKNELTAAHRTLQMPSLVRVTNLDNGRSLVVRVNDRGPFSQGRVIDVTQRAAQLLGFYGPGTAKVRIDLMADESKQLAQAARHGQSTQGMEVAINERPMTEPAPLTQVSEGGQQTEETVPGHVKNGAFLPNPIVTQQAVHPTSIYIQAGAFTSPENAKTFAMKVRGFGNVGVYPSMVNGRQFYLVRIGPVPDVPHADSLLSRVIGAGYKQAITVVN